MRASTKTPAAGQAGHGTNPTGGTPKMTSSTTVIVAAVEGDYETLFSVEYELRTPAEGPTTRTASQIIRSTCAVAVEILDAAPDHVCPTADGDHTESLTVTLYHGSAYRHNVLARCSLPAVPGVLDGVMVADIARRTLLEVAKALPAATPDWHGTDTIEAAEDEH